MPSPDYEDAAEECRSQCRPAANTMDYKPAICDNVVVTDRLARLNSEEEY